MEKLIVLYTGRNGRDGPPGEGVPGPQGPGFRARGVWSSGTVYAPGDAVVATGTAAAGIDSLFIQRIAAPTGASTVAPRDDVGRWMEVGAADLSNVTGTIWRVNQIAHGFTSVGTPVGYSTPADRWVSAGSKVGDEVAVGVVREVVSADQFIIQTTGEIIDLDPALIRPDGTAAYTPGKLYYVSRIRGRLTETPSEPAPGFEANAVIMATGPTSGVVLQWQSTPNVVGRRPVGFTEFYYDATAGQTTFSGADLDGNTLTYQVSDQNQVFVDGAFLTQFGDYTASDGLSVVLASALAGGERVVVRAIAEPLSAIAPATALVADNIGPQFDGVERRFPLTVGGGSPVVLGPAQNVLVYLDGNPQEPFVDYRITAGATTDSDIEFTQPPAPSSRFWAVVGVAVSNLAFIEVGTLLASTATAQTIGFTDGTGSTLTLGTLTVAGVGDFDILTTDDLTALLAEIASLEFTTAAGVTLGVTGATTLNTLSVTGAATLTALTASGPTTLSTLSVTGTSTLTALTASGPTTLNTLSVTGATTVAALTATGAIAGTSMALTGVGAAATLRTAVLRGPTAGGSVEAQDLIVDEGVF